jgi:hypothetical protein
LENERVWDVLAVDSPATKNHNAGSDYAVRHALRD